MQEENSSVIGTSMLVDRTFEKEMHSAFRRGVTLLKESDSEPQGSTVASPGPSRDAEGFSGVPKNASLLEPVIGKLMDKDPPKGATPEWRSTARDKAKWLQEHALRRKIKMEDLFRHLEDEMARIESLIVYEEQ